MFDLIVIGGGAAGLFGALCAKEAFPYAKVAVLEKSAVLLSKVKVSGGGRCNVTHSCFEPPLLVRNYPRGEKELLGPFHRFQPKDMIQWLEKRGVFLKTEADGRMFPVTDQSQTIIDCFLQEAARLGIEIRTRQKVQEVQKKEDHFRLLLQEGQELLTKKLLLATGSNPEGHHLAEQLGHTIQKPVPSLFTFNIPDFSLKELSGIAVPQARLSIEGTPYEQIGPLLITHFGLSGPAALKLSAWAARTLFEKNYEEALLIDWLPSFSEETVFEKLVACKTHAAQKLLCNECPFSLPKNLWKELVGPAKKGYDYSLKELRTLAQKLKRDRYLAKGKTTHKEEFVTCGGVSLKEIHFKTMESKVCPGLFFAGEVLDIDGVTGGFNFQNAWTTGFLAGSSSLL